MIVFILVSRVLLKHSKRNIDRAKEERNTKKVVAATAKTLISIISIMIMFGLSWLFGALSVSGAATVFQWLFVLFNTTQGFWLFIFFCIIGQDAREEWKKLLSCYRYEGPKKGTATPSTLSSGSRIKGRITKDTSLTSKMGNSNTIQRSVGLLEKSDFDSSVAPLEMSGISPTKTNFIDSIIEEDTDFIISNEESKQPDSQLPPQVLFRLKRPYYDLVVEGSVSPTECDHEVIDDDDDDNDSPDFLQEIADEFDKQMSNSSTELADEVDDQQKSDSNTELTEL
ncbi:hypothetical protein SPBRAN_827 [uncultured Candidatus Thioglobus sp.]|nr:hypothetical protein SPBRAN_827 [uncultured Candidatus Thioglobus sp.]